MDTITKSNYLNKLSQIERFKLIISIIFSIKVDHRVSQCSEKELFDHLVGARRKGRRKFYP
jgi:hypothetical protein